MLWLKLPVDFKKDIAAAVAVAGVLFVDDFTVQSQSLKPGLEPELGGALMNLRCSGFANHPMNIAL